MKQRVQGLVVGFFLAVLVMGSATMLAATTRTIEVTYGVNIVIDGVLHEFADDMRPFLSGGRTFVPVRGIADALGVDVQWDYETLTAYLNSKAPEAPEPTPPPMPGQAEADTIIGNWHFADFVAAYDRFVAPRDMMIIFTEDGTMIFRYGYDDYEEGAIEIVGNQIQLEQESIYPDMYPDMLTVAMLSPTITFRVDEDMLTLYHGFHFTRVYQGSGDDPLLGKWQMYVPFYTGQIFMELLPDGAALFEVSGGELIYGYYYIYHDMMLLVWDYGMMAYFYEISGDSLTLTLMIMEFFRVG